MQSSFSCGFMFGKMPNGTPRLFGAIQDASVDLKYDAKPLWGQGSFPIENARGKGNLDIKITTGRVDPDLWNELFFNTTSSAGETLGQMGESFTVPASSPYTYTAANSAHFKMDLGVYDVTSGTFLTLVSGTPATGQYAVNSTTGVYTFAAADAGKARKLYYTYTSATTGKSTTVVNTPMDAAPTFQLILSNKFNGKTLYMNFPKVQSQQLSMPFKLDDYMMPAFTASAQADDAGNVFDYSVTG